MKVLLASTRIRTPWKNGGGTTTEIAVHPPGASFDDFEWRVSIADVRQGGPFSLFPGIDRCLAVLEGEMLLSIGVKKPIVVSPQTPPALFSGDDTTDATLTGSAVVDLNVMTRRGVFAAKVAKSALTKGKMLKCNATSIALLLSGTTFDSHMLAARDALLMEAGEEITFPAGATFYWIELVAAQNR